MKRLARAFAPVLTFALALGLALPSRAQESPRPTLVELYQAFHAAPELSFQEAQSAARVAAELAAVGAEVTPGVGGHGVVAVLRNGPGPVLMLRSDLDALPVTEDTPLAFKSTVRTVQPDGLEVGVMHACGHDVHMTNLVGAARELAARRAEWSGTLILIGQPAEERGAGARAMLEDGLFERFPKPDYALAVHVKSDMEAGSIAFAAGYMLANVDSVDITVRGRGGHGAAPHTTIDPVVQAARLVLDLQTLVSRETKPTDAGVVTVGSFQCGAKHNVIPDTCHLKLTVRSYRDEVRKSLLEGIARKARAVARSDDGPEPILEISEGTPALRNDAGLAARLRPVLVAALGEANVRLDQPVMGGEDFSRYGRAGVPILMIRLGSVSEQRLRGYARDGEIPPSLHSARYYPDIEPTLRAGVQTFVAAALELLPADPVDPGDAATGSE